MAFPPQKELVYFLKGNQYKTDCYYGDDFLFKCFPGDIFLLGTRFISTT